MLLLVSLVKIENLLLQKEATQIIFSLWHHQEHSEFHLLRKINLCSSCPWWMILKGCILLVLFLAYLTDKIILAVLFFCSLNENLVWFLGNILKTLRGQTNPMCKFNEFYTINIRGLTYEEKAMKILMFLKSIFRCADLCPKSEIVHGFCLTANVALVEGTP